MVPLARELVMRGTEVILSANSIPAINDITAAELSPALNEISKVDPVIKRALIEGTLSVVASGNDLPVIDLRYVSSWAACVKSACSVIFF